MCVVVLFDQLQLRVVQVWVAAIRQCVRPNLPMALTAGSSPRAASHTTLCLMDGLHVVYSILGIHRCALELRKSLRQDFGRRPPDCAGCMLAILHGHFKPLVQPGFVHQWVAERLLPGRQAPLPGAPSCSAAFASWDPALSRRAL